ncbi:MAG: hypothetical protein OQK05_03565 [Pseudopelagicola sp.]|nr:hypothetical protein [Pseudopelagicola sp.]
MPLTAHLGTWLALCAFVAALFWGVAFAIDPYRTGPVPVDALFAKAQRKLKWHRRLSRAEKLCYDALTLYQPISDHGLAQAIPILGPERARAALYVLHETHLEKAHFTLEKALTLYDDDPEGFAAQSADLDKMLDEAAFQQLPGRLKTRLEEIMRRH